MTYNSKEIEPTVNAVDLDENMKALELNMEELSDVVGGIEAKDFKFRDGQTVRFTYAFQGKTYTYSHVRISRKKYANGVKLYYFRVKNPVSGSYCQLWVPEYAIEKIG